MSGLQLILADVEGGLVGGFRVVDVLLTQKETQIQHHIIIIFTFQCAKISLDGEKCPFQRRAEALHHHATLDRDHD